MPKLIFLGAGSIIPTESRFSSGILLEARGGLRILLDIGPGIIEKLRKVGVDLRSIQTILITHLHLDHVSDLLPLLKIRALIGGGMLRILGPKGMGEWLGLMMTDQRLFGYLSKLGCHKLIDVHELWDDSLELEPGMKISSKPVEHFNGIAYRIDLEDISITYSGDAAPDPRLIELARGSEVLIHECSFPAEKLKGKHTSDEDLLRIVAEVDPKILIVTHLYPEMEEDLQRLYQLLSKAFRGRLYVPKDLDVIEV
ncbi:MAG: hypothetical protein DRN54_01950 [Thaumarchaeota archaeon]|nr:MAG: hypothetical protein DRN54_01950 [Nitrososphaerota archaeon]